MPNNIPDTFQPPEPFEYEQPDIESSYAQASEEAALEDKARSEETPDTTEQPTQEEENEDAVVLQQEYLERQRQFRSKIKPLEDEIGELNRNLTLIGFTKLASKLRDFITFSGRTIAATSSLWITVVVFIIEFFIIIPGTFILVILGLLKGPATKALDKKIENINEQINAKQAQIAKERKNLGLDRLETELAKY